MGASNGLGLAALTAPVTSFAPAPQTLLPDPTIASITVNNSVVNGAALTMDGDTSTVLLENSSLWNMAGSSNLTNLTNANSIIQFSYPFSGYKTLTVTNYVGQNGTIVLHTFLQKITLLQTN